MYLSLQVPFDGYKRIRKELLINLFLLVRWSHSQAFNALRRTPSCTEDVPSLLSVVAAASAHLLNCPRLAVHDSLHVYPGDVKLHLLENLQERAGHNAAVTTDNEMIVISTLRSEVELTGLERNHALPPLRLSYVVLNAWIFLQVADAW